MKQHFIGPQTDDSVQTFGVGSIIGSKFRLEEKIGQGSFGMIFKCINMETQEVFAIKLEKRNQRHSSMLVREIKVMMEMKNDKGFAKMQTYGKDEEYNYVVMSYLGRNIDSLLKKCGGKFSTQTVVNLADQMISRLEALHNKNLIHRDIKPENYVIGYGSNFTVVHLIDFGLAKYYKDSDGNHIPFIEKKGMIGTARYASINAHLGHEQSRRDDLEALGYVLLYFAKGKLPWQNIYADTKDEKYEKIKAMKQQYTLEQLCENLPNEFVQYFQHVKTLEFEEAPNYTMLKKLFAKMATDKKIENQVNTLDWESLPDYRQRKKYQTVAAFGVHSKSQSQTNISNNINVSPVQNQANKKIDEKDKSNNQNNNSNQSKQQQQQQMQSIPANQNNNADKQQTKQDAKNPHGNNNGSPSPSQKSTQNLAQQPQGQNAINQKSNNKIETLQLIKLENSQANINYSHDKLGSYSKQNHEEFNETSLNNLGIPSRQEPMSNLNPLAQNYLSVPHNEKVSVMSANSGGTSKLNNYPFSESEDVTDEESIKVAGLISKENNILNPHQMLQDIRIRTSQLHIVKGSHHDLEESPNNPSSKPSKPGYHPPLLIGSEKNIKDFKKMGTYMGENVSELNSDNNRDIKIFEVKSAFKMGKK
ncbi:hypothetical protein ABPG74_002320 [Tetrahymena malaccensis]